MSAPFDTLQLARGFEAAGFPLDQAGKMAEALAQAMVRADLVTKRDLDEMEFRLQNKIGGVEFRLQTEILLRIGGMLVVSVALLLTGLGTATGIILNRLPASTTSTPAPHASVDGLAHG